MFSTARCTSWDPATGWGNAVRTVDGIVHEVSTISIEDTTYLIVAHQEGTDYTTDGATWLSVGGVGTRDTSGDFTLTGTNSRPYAMIILEIGGTDYILVGDRTDNKFYAYTKAGNRSQWERHQQLADFRPGRGGGFR